MASLVTLATFNDTAAPMESWLVSAWPFARALALVWLVVPAVSIPPDVTVTPSSIEATVLVVITLTETAAATPTCDWPLAPPEALLALLPGEVNWLFDDGGAATLGAFDPLSDKPKTA